MIGTEFTLPCLDGLFQRGALGAEGREVGHGRAFALHSPDSGISPDLGGTRVCITPGFGYCRLR
jgi:hypothetical protein